MVENFKILIRDFFTIAVFCILDLLLVYVFLESVLIHMMCGADHLIFAVQTAASGVCTRLMG